jgi:hypothetical protein
MKNVFVLVIDDFARHELVSVPAAAHWRFHTLPDYDEAVVSACGTRDFEQTRSAAEAWLDAWEGDRRVFSPDSDERIERSLMCNVLPAPKPERDGRAGSASDARARR